MKADPLIEVLFFAGCPNHAPTMELIRDVLRSREMPVAVHEIEVATPEQAQAIGFLGSPTVRIGGLDIEPDARPLTTFGMGCRTYMDAGRRTGIPSRELIVRALDESASVVNVAAVGDRAPAAAGNSGVLVLGGVSAILASTCCLGPLLLVTLGFSGAWIGSLTRLEPFRPFFIGFALVAMFFAGRQIFRPPAACAPGDLCAQPPTRRLYKFMFWATGALIVIAALTPHLAKYFY